MECRLTRQFGANSYGWVDRALNWESNGLGSISGEVTFKFFFLVFFKLAPKNRSVKVVCLFFFVFFLIPPKRV